MNFRKKLYVGFGTILCLILILSVVALQMLTKLKVDINSIVENNFASVKDASSIRMEINNIGRNITDLLLSKDKSKLYSYLDSIEASKMKVSGDWTQLSQLASSPGQDNAGLLGNFYESYTKYIKSLDRLTQMIQDGKDDEALAFYNSDTEDKRAELFTAIMSFNNKYERQMDQSLDDSNGTYWLTVYILATIVAIIFLLSAVTAWWVFRSVTGSLREVANAMNDISFAEENLPRIRFTAKDEIGSIAETFNRMAHTLEQRSRSEKGYQKELQEKNMRQSMVAEISTLLQGVQDVNKLAQLFIDHITPMMGAGYGIFYAQEVQNDDSACMVKLASYAGEAEGVGTSRFYPDEGLVGQCVRECKSIILDAVPGDYIRIRSGLGEAAPCQLVLMPVPYEGKAIAVMELASFQSFNPGKLNILEEMVEILGMALSGAFAYKQIQKLLRESQLSTEELQTQSEELQLQQEELRTLNERLEEQYRDIDTRNKELQIVKIELEEKNRQVMISSQYKTEFLANVSHELRTPLNSLLVLAQLLAENKEGNLFPKQIEYVKTIHTSGADLLMLINEILDLSKIESGKMDVVMENIALKELVHFINGHFGPVAEQKGLDFQVIVDESVSLTSIGTDIQKLQQILNNLVSNAMKFTEAGSVTLTIRVPGQAEAEDLGAPVPEEEYLAISVSDTGIGIAKDKQAMVFEAFRQADGTTSRKYGGTGLGLSISKELASLLGGTIYLTSEEGKGSTFTLLIPVQGTAIAIAQQEVAAATFMKKDQSTEQLEGKTILLVDDDMRNIFALTGVLESYGTNVLFAEDGLEGLSMLQKHPETDLVLMDIMMPKMDGYETIRAIRESDGPYRDLPIIALTAKAMRNDKEKCLEAGANDYISKPIQSEQLLSLLRVWLHR